MSEPELRRRRRTRDICPGRVPPPGVSEQALLDRLEQLRSLVAEYEELRRWAARLGIVLMPVNRPSR